MVMHFNYYMKSDYQLNFTHWVNICDVLGKQQVYNFNFSSFLFLFDFLSSLSWGRLQ